MSSLPDLRQDTISHRKRRKSKRVESRLCLLMSGAVLTLVTISLQAFAKLFVDSLKKHWQGTPEASSLVILPAFEKPEVLRHEADLRSPPSEQLHSILCIARCYWSEES